MLRNFDLIKNHIYERLSNNNSIRINNYRIYYQNLKDKYGLEIGEPSPIFEEKSSIPIYPIAKNIDRCNFSERTVWQVKNDDDKNYEESSCQFITDTVKLRGINSDSYDFILASHVLEHIANPFKAISEWLRVLKKEGILLLILPLKEATFDHKRSVTTIKHLIKDFENDVNEDDLSHLTEILKLHDLSLDPLACDLNLFKERSLLNYENRCLHHHVFDTNLLVSVLNYFKINIISMELLLPNNIIILGNKTKNFNERDNDIFYNRDLDFILRTYLSVLRFLICIKY